MTCRCHVIDQDLVITDSVTGRTVWRGKLDGYPVWKALAIPNSDDCIVLLEYWARPEYPFQNLLRIGRDGSIRWRAQLPDIGADAYISIRLTEHELMASSWSGFRVVLDPETGSICSQEFTKGM